MTPDEARDARVTAYALNDPGLTDADRREVAQLMLSDPAVKHSVEETRRLADVLTAGLHAEQAAVAPAGEFVTVPAAPAAVSAARSRREWLVAAAVLLAVGGAGYLAMVGGGHGSAGTPRPEVAGIHRGGAEVGQADALARPDLGLLSDLSPAVDPAAGAAPAPPRGEVARSEPRMAGPPGAEGGMAGGMMPGEKPAGKSAVGGGFGGGFGGQPGGPGARPGGFGGGGFGGGGFGLPGAGGPAAKGGPGGGPAQPDGAGYRFAEAKPEFEKRAKPGYIAPGTPAPDAYAEEPGRPRSKLSLRGLNTADARSADRYPALIENEFVPVEGQQALSTFGIDVDTASYSIVRKYLDMGQLPPAAAVRLEEMVNYFPYRDKAPDGNDPFAVTVETAECPWRPQHRLARIGLKARPVDTDKRPPSNLVFLIDVSGSMNEPNKLPLVKQSLKMLLAQLGENDRVAMVVYAGASGLVLDSTPATNKAAILSALDHLEAGGSTNGSGGLMQAYSVASANFVKGGTNRVILCTDGDWNVGTTGTADLVKLVEEKRGTGVFLSVLGFGMGNLRDEMMVQLAGKGNGNYAYIDTAREAHKSLVEQLGGTLVTVAKDVKIQVEFNPAVVRAYRLLGYEKRALAAKDFSDDRKDAGEMGAGHVVTALYELVPAAAAAPVAAEPKGEPLRYQPAAAPKPAAEGVKANEAFVVKMRHKKPDGDVSTLREVPVLDRAVGYDRAGEDFRFAAAVASFAMLLRESPYKGNATFAAVLELADAAKSHDPGGYRAEFVEMVRKAKAVSGKP